MRALSLALLALLAVAASAKPDKFEKMEKMKPLNVNKDGEAAMSAKSRAADFKSKMGSFVKRAEKNGFSKQQLGSLQDELDAHHERREELDHMKDNYRELHSDSPDTDSARAMKETIDAEMRALAEEHRQFMDRTRNDNPDVLPELRERPPRPERYESKEETRDRYLREYGPGGSYERDREYEKERSRRRRAESWKPPKWTGRRLEELWVMAEADETFDDTEMAQLREEFDQYLHDEKELFSRRLPPPGYDENGHYVRYYDDELDRFKGEQQEWRDIRDRIKYFENWVKREDKDEL